MKKVISIILLVAISLLSLSSCQLVDMIENYISSDKQTPIKLPKYEDEVKKLPAKDEGGETTLEFWIGEKVGDYDWSSHDEIIGWFGAREYLGTGYKKYYSDYHEADMKPKHHVSYLVSSYPDESSPNICITRIDITDPTVKLYGLTTESTLEEFTEKFTSLGFTVSDIGSTGKVKIAGRDGVSFSFSLEFDEETPAKISIVATTSNLHGIIY